MKELKFSKAQKEILLKALKENFNSKYSKELYRQMYHNLSKVDRHFFTTTWSRGAWICISSMHEFDKEDEAYNEYETAKLFGKELEQPTLSKQYKLWHDLEVRIRAAWDQNRTLEIIFEE